MTDRRSYRGLLALPAWGLYAGTRLVASVRATDAYAAREVFRKHSMHGERVRRIRPGSENRGTGA